MATLNLKFEGDGTFTNPYRARIVSQGDDLNLSADCRTPIELEEQANYLKKQLDEIVATARQKFPKK